MYSPCDDTALPVTGFPIRKSPGQRSLSTSPKLIAASHVLHRLLAPRHPPYALNSLVTSSWVSYLVVTHVNSTCTRHCTLSNSLCSYQRSKRFIESLLPMQSVNSKNDGPSSSRTAWESSESVELIGIEPTTSGLQSPRSPS